MPVFEKPTEAGGIAARLAAARAVMEAAQKAAHEQKTVRSRSRKKDAEEIAAAAQLRSEQYQKLGDAATSWNDLQDIAFEPLFRALAVELKKDGQMPVQFDNKLKELREIKQALAEFDGAPESVRSDAAAQAEFEAIRAEATTLMQSWARILSVWFAEHAHLREKESQEADAEVQALLSDPLFTADFRVAEEPFERAAHREVLEFGDAAFQRTRLSLQREFGERGNGKTEGTWDGWSKTVFAYITFYRGKNSSMTADTLAQFVTELKPLNSHHGRIDEQKVTDLLQKYFPDYHTYFNKNDYCNNERVRNQVAVGLDLMVAGFRKIERVAEAERIFTEQRMRAVQEIIAHEFDTEDERKKALSFIRFADEHIASGHQWCFGDVSVQLPTGPYAIDPPPEWLMRAYRELNSTYLFGDLLTKNLEKVRRRFGTDQVLRMYLGEDAYAKKDIKPEQFKVNTNESRFPSGNGVRLSVERQHEKEGIRTVSYRSERLKDIPVMTLDPELIAVADSLNADLESDVFDGDTNEAYETLRAFIVACDVHPFIADGHAGKRVDQVDAGLKRYIAGWREDLDRHMHTKRPTPRERLDALARKDGVVELTSAADGAEAIGVLRGLVEQYLYEERPKMQAVAATAESKIKSAADAAQAEALVAQQRAQDAERRAATANASNESLRAQKQQLQETHDKHAERLTRDLLEAQGKVHHLTGRLSAEQSESIAIKAELARKLEAALKEAHTLEVHFIGGDGKRYVELKNQVNTLLAQLKSGN